MSSRLLILAQYVVFAFSVVPHSNCSTEWPDLELFVPVNLKGGESNKRIFEWENIFLRSFSFFWPQLSRTKVRFLVDQESIHLPEYQPFLHAIQRYDHFVVNVSTNNFPADSYHNSGRHRQQLAMFMADIFTDAEYIGFGDTDCLFITHVDKEDIFEGGKPVINGRIGKPESFFWEGVPRSSHWLLGGIDGYEEPMRCMSYFPVVVKATHLRDMREKLLEIHQGNGSETFFDLFKHYSGLTFYSQFGGICAYLWHFKREEYIWYVHDTDPTWNFVDPFPSDGRNYGESRRADGLFDPPLGQIKNKSIFTPEMLVPKPRIAIHTRYHFRPNAPPFEQIIANGFCRSPPFPKPDAKLESFCRELVGKTGPYNEDMHSYETAQWYLIRENNYQERIKRQQDDRTERIRHCRRDWDYSIYENQIQAWRAGSWYGSI